MEVCALLLGDGACGKSSLLGSIVTERFQENGAEGFVPQKRIKFGSEVVDLSLIDTTGEDDSDRMRVNNYPKADAIVLCFSIISPLSYENLKSKYLPEIRRYAPDKPLILLGLKTDLRYDEEALSRLSARKMTPLSFAQGMGMQRELGAIAFVECSAKGMVGIEDVVNSIIATKYSELVDKKQKAEKRKSAKFAAKKDGKCEIV